MKFKRHMQLEHGLGQLDIAPLIDVIFQLLIFFMLTSSFVLRSGIRVNLPQAVTSEVVKDKNVIITVSAENVLYLGGSVVTLDELKARLKAVKRVSGSVLIKADSKAYLGRVVEIWDLCREIGLEQINVATNQQVE
ncbi:MAG: biopolymer transporter ExbD [Candidatus Omnitrophica bacterium]|nr:biopolymer transporter ExbD [Candidatus Omnitrophota bacterium]